MMGLPLSWALLRHRSHGKGLPALWRSLIRGETTCGLLLAWEAQDDGKEQHGDGPLVARNGPLQCSVLVSR